MRLAVNQFGNGPDSQGKQEPVSKPGEAPGDKESSHEDQQSTNSKDESLEVLEVAENLAPAEEGVFEEEVLVKRSGDPRSDGSWRSGGNFLQRRANARTMG